MVIGFAFAVVVEGSVRCTDKPGVSRKATARLSQGFSNPTRSCSVQDDSPSQRCHHRALSCSTNLRDAKHIIWKVTVVFRFVFIVFGEGLVSVYQEA
jgi:hypothetical protein